MSEIVIPADRFTLRYRIPVGRAGLATHGDGDGDPLAAVPAAAPAGAGLPA
jgi:hypothetical protein